MEKLKVGILGATGMVGRHYISLLENHPWFEVGYVAASPRSAGKKYADAVAGKWHLKEPIPNVVKELVVHAVDEIEEAKRNCSFVFSAVDSDIAREWEEKYAEAGIPVISNASAHRNAKDVPMLIPEINPGHTEIIPVQRKNRGWGRGFIAVKPNCSIQCYMAPLYALHNDFKVRQVVVTTMQAISGAGHSSFDTIDMSETLKHKPFASAGGKQASVSEHAQEHAPGFSPGVLDIEDNIIPFISGEEEKSEREPLKIMGKIKGDEITCNDEFSVSAHCNRVPVTDGHMACVSVKFKKRPAKEQILEAWKNFRARWQGPNRQSRT